MPETFRNDRSYGIMIPVYNVYAPSGTIFTVPDSDNGSLYDDPGYTYLSGLTSDVLLNEDGTFLTCEDSTLIALT